MTSKALSFIQHLTERPSLSLRAYYRLARVGLHCCKLSIKLPKHHLQQRLRGQPDYHLLENDSFSQWLNQLIQLLNVEVVVHGQPDIDSGLYVSNHISWLDAVVIANISNFSFIAKNEVKQWPLIGQFGQMTQTLFIERQNKFSVYRSLPTLEQHLNMNRSILLFPEGTTSRGETVLPFFTMLYEAAVRTEKPIQAITLRYTDLNNHFLPEIEKRVELIKSGEMKTRSWNEAKKGIFSK